MNNRALSEYVNAVNEVSDLLQGLKQYVVEDNMGLDPKDVNWGHVGKVKYAQYKLKELFEFLEGRG